MGDERKKFYNLLKATRMNRAFPSISLIIFAIAWVNFINKEIYFLAINCILLYGAGGILNAIKDKDYEVPKYSNFILLFITFMVFLFSLSNKILLVATLAWIILGFIYNTFSRKIILLDTTIMAMTHYFIPLFFGLIILGMNSSKALVISTVIYFVFWLIIPLKNLHGIEKDKRLGYKTLPILSKYGISITIIFFYLSFISMIYIYIFFNFPKVYLLFLGLLLILYLTTSKLLVKTDKSLSIPLTRFTMLIFTSALIISKTQNAYLLLANMFFVLFFAIAFIQEFKK